MLDGIELGTVGRIMHNEKVHIQPVGKVHEILLDNAVGGEFGSSAIAEYDQGARAGVRFEMLRPDPLYVVAHEPGRVVARAYCHISDIPRHVIDAVRDNLPVGERKEVMAKGPGLAVAEGLAVTL